MSKARDEFPDRIYANRIIGTNGIHCLDYKCEDDDIEYIRIEKYKEIEEQKSELLKVINTINNTNAAYLYRWIGDLCNETLKKYTTE